MRCVWGADLVHILQGQAEGEVVGPLGGDDGVQRLQEDGALVPTQSRVKEEG